MLKCVKYCVYQIRIVRIPRRRHRHPRRHSREDRRENVGVGVGVGVVEYGFILVKSSFSALSKHCVFMVYVQSQSGVYQHSHRCVQRLAESVQ